MQDYTQGLLRYECEMHSRFMCLNTWSPDGGGRASLEAGFSITTGGRLQHHHWRQALASLEAGFRFESLVHFLSNLLHCWRHNVTSNLMLLTAMPSSYQMSCHPTKIFPKLQAKISFSFSFLQLKYFDTATNKYLTKR